MMKETHKPRKVSKIEADIFRELIFSKRALAIFPKDPSKKIHFFEAGSSPAIETTFSFSLQVGQQKVDLAIELKPETPVAKRLNEVGGLEALPEEFRGALMNFASREISDVIEHLFQLPVKPWDVACDKEEATEKKELCFELLDAHGACEARVGMSLGTALVERLLAVAKEIPVVKKPSLTKELFKGEVFIGSAKVPLADWERLRPGDLIMVEEPSALTTGEGKYFLKNNGTIPIVLKKDLFKPLVQPIETVFPIGIKPAMPMIPASQGEGVNTEEKKLALRVTGSIALELCFSAGLMALTIAELLQLMKTKSLEKAFQVSNPLKIFIQNQIVGAGKLVEINGCYAVAVTSLEARAAKAAGWRN